MFVENTGEWEILGGDGNFHNFKGISKTSNTTLRKLKTETGDIWASDKHIFFKNGKVIKVKDLYNEDYIDGITGNQIIKKTNEVKQDFAYDIIECKETNHKYVIFEKILTHNCDEFAFVRDSVQQEFWASISPTLATGGDCIICSTPNGDTNIFAQIWTGANIPENHESDIGINGFFATEVKWDEPPDRDEKFKQQEIAKMGVTKWTQEFECLRGNTFVEIQDEFNNIISIQINDLYKKLMYNEPLA